MRRKPKYLDRERRAARAAREYWEGAKWSPTQRKDLQARQMKLAEDASREMLAKGLHRLVSSLNRPDFFNGFNRVEGDAFTGGPKLIR